MTEILGKITAQLADSTDSMKTIELVDLINNNINPPQKVTPDDIHIRAMYIASDQINSFGGRFPVEELTNLSGLLIDSPVLVGHRKDKLPIGRNFHAITEVKNNKNWVKSYFYWLKSADQSENLKQNIDGGIYKECSIGFTFHFAECSVCGKDIRTCSHEPLQKISNRSVYFNYRKIGKVLETSLVYRGAVPNTSVTKDLQIDYDKTLRLINPDNFKDSRYLITPLYDGIILSVSNENSKLIFKNLDGTRLISSRLSLLENLNLPNLKNKFGLLVGYRGKERCSAHQLERYLKKISSPVTHLEFKIIPHEVESTPEISHESLKDKIKPIKHHWAKKDEILITCKKISTKAGVKIWNESRLLPDFTGHTFKPDKVNQNQKVNCSYDPTSTKLKINHNGTPHCFHINKLNLKSLLNGIKFIATPSSELVETMPHELNLEGHLNGKFLLRPIRIKQKQLFLFYKAVASIPQG